MSRTHAPLIPNKRLNFVDLFAGAAGFTLGLMDASDEPRVEFVPRLMVDIDGSARVVAMRNLPQVPYWQSDIHLVSGAEILRRAGIADRLDVLIGGPPCQGFSFLGKRALGDERNVHIVDYLRIVKELRPLVSVMENVPLVITNYGGAVINEVCDTLSQLGYSSCAGILTANEYGVPQIRRRAFVIAYHSDLHLTPELPRRTHERIGAATELLSTADRLRFDQDKMPYVSVEDAIGDLPPLDSGKGQEVVMYLPTGSALTAYQEWARKGSVAIFNHQSRAHSAAYLKKISVIGEGGRNQDLPDSKRFSDNYFSQAYARLHRNSIANTITTSFANPGSGRFLHYRDLRSITVREAARLQSFPDWYVFEGDMTAQMRHVGNAVPPLLARAIRDQIARDLLSNSDPKINKPEVLSVTTEEERKKERSRVMRAVPSKNTSTEMSLRSALTKAGIRGYQLHCKDVPGSPDVAFRRWKVAIFVDGCFWHGCPKCYRKPSSNQAYWQMKVKRNRDRDSLVNKLCADEGWQVIRVWEHEVASDPKPTIGVIKKALAHSAKRNKGPQSASSRKKGKTKQVKK